MEEDAHLFVARFLHFVWGALSVQKYKVAFNTKIYGRVFHSRMYGRWTSLWKTTRGGRMRGTEMRFSGHPVSVELVLQLHPS